MGNIKGKNIWDGIEVDDEITIDGLIEQLSVFSDWEITQYDITEDFDKIDKHTYNVHNLEASVINIGGYSVVMFNDIEQIIKKDLKRVLNIFSLDDLLKIEHSWDTSYKAILTFKDGTIIIERIKNVH